MKPKLLLLSVLLLLNQAVFAYDFSAICSTGQTLYYNITSDTTVTLTYPGNLGRGQYHIYNSSTYNWPNSYSSPYSDYANDNGGTIYKRETYKYPKPTGRLRVPMHVNHNGHSYRVSSVHGWAFYGCTNLYIIFPKEIPGITSVS